MSKHTLPLPKAPMTRRMVIRAILKGLCLFFAFNVVYGLIKPFQRGHVPSLYNVAFPGRVRFMKDYEFDPYRLVDDHAISAATSDTFNIVVLGSSEMWGTHSLADDAVPAIMDRYGLVAADGRPVRMYNLGHPIPYGLKDLILMEVLFRREIPVDLVIWSTFDSTLSYYYPYHLIVKSNFDLQIEVIDHYNLTAAYQYAEGIYMGRSIPVFTQLWEDRSLVRTWLQMQMRGILWGLTRMDLSNVDANHLTEAYHMDVLEPRLTLTHLDTPPNTDFLYAFRQLSHEREIPVLVLSSPVPFEENEFSPWLQVQTQGIGLPLLDCWDVFRDPTYFEDVYHIRPEIHAPYARILASALSDPQLAAEGPGLPLKLPPDFELSPESCTLYPTSSR